MFYIIIVRHHERKGYDTETKCIRSSTNYQRKYSRDALKNAEELAILADELGYYRMWMAEHHGTDEFASSAPEVSAAHLAAKRTIFESGLVES